MLIHCPRGSLHVNIGDERLPKVKFGELVGGKGYTEGRNNERMEFLEIDLQEYDTNFEGWGEVAQKADRWGRRVEDRSGCLHAEMA